MRGSFAENLEGYVRTVGLISVMYDLSADEMGIPDETIMRNPIPDDFERQILREARSNLQTLPNQIN